MKGEEDGLCRASVIRLFVGGRSPHTCTLLAVNLFLAACGDSGGGRVLQLQRVDSGGVEIVTNTGPAAGEGAWTIVSEPELRIGSLDGPEPTQFTFIRDVTRTPDGRIVVVESQSLEIRVFAPDGRFLNRIGRKGEGPGEFAGLVWATLAPPDTLIVWDPIAQRLSRFDLEGALLSQESLASRLRQQSITVPFGLWHLTRDGALLFAMTDLMRRARARGLTNESYRVVRFERDGQSAQSFGEVPAGGMFMTEGRVGLENPFAPVAWVEGSVPPLPVVIAGPGPWELRSYGTDAVLRRIVRAAVAQTPPEAVVDALRASFVERHTGPGRPEDFLEEIFAKFEVPDSLGAIGALYHDRAGNLWVTRRDWLTGNLSTFDIIDGSGRWVTTVRKPPEIGGIREFGDDYILAVTSDDLDVPYVELHRIVKTAVGGK